MALKLRRYAIIDLETTGGKASRDKITEIGIVIHDGEKVLDTYETLLNPDTYIPTNITRLTGITQEMVQDAPRFHEVARKIVEMTEGTVFVAHNVRFDYGFLREEFGRLGYTFTRKQLCTVKMSRKWFPGLPSYSLENLIKHFKITVKDRHRALEDALATTTLFEKIIQQQNDPQDIYEMVNMGIKESKLPKGITLEQIHDLPEECGVYYFHDAQGNVVYVGKSLNIKKRIANHFADQTEKGRRLQKHVANISFELTGSELVALLLESHEIKRIRPLINRAQRRKTFPFAIHRYENGEGFLCFDVIKNTSKTKDKFDIISEYPTMSAAKSRLNMVVTKYELCARFCHIFPGSGACFNFHIKQCRGGCAGHETPELYNERAEAAQAKMRTVFDKDFFIIDKGRATEERSIILVRQGLFCGFGYLTEEQMLTPEDLEDAIKTYPGNAETSRIIQTFLSKHPATRLLEV